MVENGTRRLTGYDAVGFLLSVGAVVASVWLTTQRYWLRWELHGTPFRLEPQVVKGVMLFMLLILASCLAVPSRFYGNRILHRAGSVATGIALALTITALGLALAAIIGGVVIYATFSDEQEASCACAVLVAVGMAILFGAVLFLGTTIVLRKKTGPERVPMIIGTVVTLVFLSGVACAHFWY